MLKLLVIDTRHDSLFSLFMKDVFVVIVVLYQFVIREINRFMLVFLFG